MKITQDRPGASHWAEFDKPIYEMNLKETQSLLQAILHRAMPAEENGSFVFAELEIAEQCWKEQLP